MSSRASSRSYAGDRTVRDGRENRAVDGLFPTQTRGACPNREPRRIRSGCREVPLARVVTAVRVMPSVTGCFLVTSRMTAWSRTAPGPLGGTSAVCGWCHRRRAVSRRGAHLPSAVGAGSQVPGSMRCVEPSTSADADVAVLWGGCPSPVGVTTGPSSRLELPRVASTPWPTNRDGPRGTPRPTEPANGDRTTSRFR